MYNQNNLSNNNINPIMNGNVASSKLPGNYSAVPIIVCILCAVVSLGLGIFSCIRAEQANQKIDALSSDVYSDTGPFEEGADESSTCVLPGNVEDIEYLSLSYNNGRNQIFVGSEGEIYYYSFGENSSENEFADEQTVTTDTTEILTKAMSEGLDEYSNYDESAYDDDDWLVWNYESQLWTNDGHICQAGGQKAPKWFNDLVDLANSKK